MKEYNEGKTALETAKTDADKQFADAQKKIDDGREKLEKTSRPEWYLFTVMIIRDTVNTVRMPKE